MNDEPIARALATAFVAGALEVDGLVDRGSKLLGQQWRWLRLPTGAIDAPHPGQFMLVLVGDVGALY